MNIEKTNEKLHELYKFNYPKLTDLLTKKNKSLEHKDRATNPLLLKIDKTYANAGLKIMVFGQETNYWHSEKNKGEFHGEIESVLNLYEDFFLSGNCFSYGGQFWNGISRFNQLLKEQTGKEIGLVWNNIIKIGKCGKGKPFASIQEIQFENFNVIQKEIEILKPDYLVFFSGPNYDVQIKKAFKSLNKIEIKEFTERQLCELRLTENQSAFRTYHPNYLWRNNINNYLNKITDRINTLHNIG